MDYKTCLMFFKTKKLIKLIFLIKNCYLDFQSFIKPSTSLKLNLLHFLILDK